MRRARAHDGQTPGGDPVRFPGYDVLAQRNVWDPATAAVVDARCRPAAGLRFFTPSEAPTVGALLDRLLAQDREPRVPVLAMIDARLATGCGDGYRYDDMPEDGDAWHRSVIGLDADAHEAGAPAFHRLARDAQMDLIESIATGDGRWYAMPAKRVFDLWVRYACAAFYSHPWAWNEIGFGGPAYPRGYGNLGLDGREPWERPERDANDPVPWAERAEAAKQAHARRAPKP